jgi:hypothetical protein
MTPTYINRFLSLSIAPDLLSGVSWTTDPGKEITESMGALAALLNLAGYIGAERDDPSVSVLVVGDGTTPRTAALIALSTAWKVDSVDPAMRRTGIHPLTKRLTCHRARLEDTTLRASIVVAVHSHATPLATRMAADDGVVSMPCCVPWGQPLPRWGRWKEYRDLDVLSPQNLILVEVPE